MILKSKFKENIVSTLAGCPIPLTLGAPQEKAILFTSTHREQSTSTAARVLHRQKLRTVWQANTRYLTQGCAEGFSSSKSHSPVLPFEPTNFLKVNRDVGERHGALFSSRKTSPTLFIFSLSFFCKGINGLSTHLRY